MTDDLGNNPTHTHSQYLTAQQNDYVESAELIDSGGGEVVDHWVKVGNMSTTNGNTASAAFAYWLTRFAPMVELSGKNLYAIKVDCVSAGTMTVWGYDDPDNLFELSAIYDRASGNSAATAAEAGKVKIADLSLTSGTNTYYLNGTDGVVCPKVLGFQFPTSGGATVKYHNNQTSGFMDGYPSPSSYYGNVGSQLFVYKRTSGGYNANACLAFEFLYKTVEASSSSTSKSLQLTMKSGTEHTVDLSDIIYDPTSITSRVTSLENRFSLEGKKLSIIGDSISTFNGYIPTGYDYFYPKTGTGYVSSVDDMWWKKLADETGLSILKNASWSGSCVTNESTAYSTAQCASTNARINDLADNGTNPDIIICYIGINDFFQVRSNGTRYSKALGDYTALTALSAQPEDEMQSETFYPTTFSEAYALMLGKIMTTYPSAKVYCCTLPEANPHNSNYQGDTDGFPVFNQLSTPLTLVSYNDRIRTLARNMGARIIELHDCGINYWNVNSYTQDGLHPLITGHELIKNKIKSALLND